MFLRCARYVLQLAQPEFWMMTSKQSKGGPDGPNNRFKRDCHDCRHSAFGLESIHWVGHDGQEFSLIAVVLARY